MYCIGRGLNNSQGSGLKVGLNYSCAGFSARESPTDRDNGNSGPHLPPVAGSHYSNYECSVFELLFVNICYVIAH